MSRKANGRLGAIMAVLFTSVVAPVLVDFAEGHLEGSKIRPHRTLSPGRNAQLPVPSSTGDPGRTTLVVHLGAPEPVQPEVSSSVPAMSVTQVVVRGNTIANEAPVLLDVADRHFDARESRTMLPGPSAQLPVTLSTGDLGRTRTPMVRLGAPEPVQPEVPEAPVPATR